LSLETQNQSAGLFKKEVKDLLKNDRRKQHLLNFGLRSAISGNHIFHSSIARDCSHLA
jgi:hypothetical protein